MEKSINYNGLTVETMNTFIATPRGTLHGKVIFFKFDGEDRKFTLDIDQEGHGIWMMSQPKFQTIDNFLKGIDNLMKLGNDFQKTKVLNLCHRIMDDCYYNRIENNDSELCCFLAAICELGVFGTYEAQRGWSKDNWNDFYKIWLSTYRQNVNLDRHSATKKEF